jgi:integrase
MTNVTHLHQTSSPSQAPTFTVEQKAFIDDLRLPAVMAIDVAAQDDTPHVQTKNDRWEYVRLGRIYILKFDLSREWNKLLKLLVIKYSSGHLAPLSREMFSSIKTFIRTLEDVSYGTFYKWLEIRAASDNAHGYCEVKSFIRYLVRMRFPGFDIDDLESLVRLPVPSTTDPFLRYQDVEAAMPSHFKNLIVNRLVEFGTPEGLLTLNDQELKHISVLAISYAVGCRPQQYAKLIGGSVKLHAVNHKTGLKRYLIAVPLVKQSAITDSTTPVALSSEIGRIIDEYKKRFNIENEDTLYPYDGDKKRSLSQQIHKLLNDALLFIQPDDVKVAIANGRMDAPTYTLYDFRHNIGHSMAMLNASAEEIAMVLGHASKVAASYYIQATPDLALLKHKALGSNPVWKGMMGLLLTGYSVDETEWQGYFVSGIIRGKLIKRVGGCERHQKICHLQKVRSCYGCFYFRPFRDISLHRKVLDTMAEELIDVVDVSQEGQGVLNPLIDTATQTKNEIEMVINRLEAGCR